MIVNSPQTRTCKFCNDIARYRDVQDEFPYIYIEGSRCIKLAQFLRENIGDGVGKKVDKAKSVGTALRIDVATRELTFSPTFHDRLDLLATYTG